MSQSESKDEFLIPGAFASRRLGFSWWAMHQLMRHPNAKVSFTTLEVSGREIEERVKRVLQPSPESTMAEDAP